MPSDLELLLQLQTIDYDLGELERSKEYLPDMMDNLRREIDEVKSNHETTASELEEAKVEVTLDLQEVPKIHLDEKLIKHAVLNLVKNALAAMPGGGHLHIASGIRNENVFLEIADTGSGIPEKNLSKIFEPYFTTKDFSSGLGLTLVYKIVKEHRGEVAVKSKEGQGTTFSLSFPIPQEEKKLIGFKGEER